MMAKRLWLTILGVLVLSMKLKNSIVEGLDVNIYVGKSVYDHQSQHGIAFAERELDNVNKVWTLPWSAKYQKMFVKTFIEWVLKTRLDNPHFVFHHTVMVAPIAGDALVPNPYDRNAVFYLSWLPVVAKLTFVCKGKELCEQAHLNEQTAAPRWKKGGDEQTCSTVIEMRGLQTGMTVQQLLEWAMLADLEQHHQRLHYTVQVGQEQDKIDVDGGNTLIHVGRLGPSREGKSSWIHILTEEFEPRGIKVKNAGGGGGQMLEMLTQEGVPGELTITVEQKST